MKQRCLNPNNKDYARYGGRGISVCERWLDWSNFINDMGIRPFNKSSIDRIDNNGNYEPDNCRWATAQEQVDNQIKSGVFKHFVPPLLPSCHKGHEFTAANTRHYKGARYCRECNKLRNRERRKWIKR